MDKFMAMELWERGMGGPVPRKEKKEVQHTIERWLKRGDQVLVYRNEDLSHPKLGHVQMVSYGSGHATLERNTYDRPPTTMPDFPGKVNFRYQLAGIIDPDKESHE